MRRAVGSNPGAVAMPSTICSISRSTVTPTTLLLRRVWELRHNLTAYDAVYVALAEVLDAPLLTRDRRLDATAGHEARVELV